MRAPSFELGLAAGLAFPPFGLITYAIALPHPQEPQ